MFSAAIPFPEISPEVFAIGPFALRWYALAYIAGIIIGWRLAVMALRRARLWPNDRAPITPAQLEDLVSWIILGVILGGRLGYVLFYDRAHYLANPVDILKLWHGGMAFHGGALGVLIVLIIWARRTRAPLAQVADVLALATPPGLLLGRIANFINAELWGRPADVPWAVIFPGEAAQSCSNLGAYCARHPSQLYEAALEGLLLGALLLVLVYGTRVLKRPGLLTGIFMAGYGAARIFVETFRLADAQFITPDNPWGHVALGMTMGQLLSLPMLLAGLALALWAARR